jgi:hypothetical protein
MLIYLGICAVGAFLAAVAAAFLGVTAAGDFIPAAPTVHIAFAGGAMPLVFGAIIHFVPVLTRTGAPHAAIRLLPLPVQLAGLAATLALAGALPWWALHPAATLAALAAMVLAAWIVRRLRATLGAPHPGARWYVAALLALLAALAVVPPLAARPELRAVLRLLHLHLNTLGFIGLAALGTLPVLVPTALGRPEPTTAARLRTDLWPAVAGATLLAIGAAFAWPLALLGALPLAAVAVRHLLAWYRAYGMAAILGDGATAPLAAATLGFLTLLALGMLHGAGLIEARPAIAGYAALFLLPLVTGALTQLLPVWRHPGAATPARAAMRERLAAGGRWRALLFLAGGVLLSLPSTAGMTPVALALLWFGIGLVRALGVGRRRA